MKRRTFIQLFLVTGAALSIPYLNNIVDGIGLNNPLDFPAMLSNFCDEDELLRIGSAYRKMNPSEDSKEILTRLLLKAANQKKVNAVNSSRVGRLIAREVHTDFENDRTVLVNGWVLSPTEARQCALLSLSKKV